MREISQTNHNHTAPLCTPRGEQQQGEFSTRKTHALSTTGQDSCLHSTSAEPVGFKSRVMRCMRAEVDYISQFSVCNLIAMTTSAAVHPLSAIANHLLLDRVLTNEGFWVLLQCALKADKALNASLSYLGFNARNVLSGLPVMKHAFYPEPAETARAIVDWITNTAAGKIFSCAVVSSVLSGAAETYKTVKGVCEAAHVNPDLNAEEALRAKIANYKSLANKELVTVNSIKETIISAAISSLFAGPVLGLVATGSANGARMGIQKLGQWYCHRQQHKLEAELAQAIEIAQLLNKEKETQQKQCCSSSDCSSSDNQRSTVEMSCQTKENTASGASPNDTTNETQEDNTCDTAEILPNHNKTAEVADENHSSGIGSFFNSRSEPDGADTDTFDSDSALDSILEELRKIQQLTIEDIKKIDHPAETKS